MEANPQLRLVVNNFDQNPSMRDGLTDPGNAQRFVRQHGDKVRYVTTQNRWLLWNGRYWGAVDSQEIIKPKLKKLLDTKFHFRLAPSNQSAQFLSASPNPA